jgi:Tol biopolymer transport system component
MNGGYDLDRELGTYLEGRATSHAPDGLLDVSLGQVGATSQRPGWSVPDRWFSARTTARLGLLMRSGPRVALLVLLIAVAVAAVLIVGSQPRRPPPFGPARPGLIVYTSEGHLFVENVDGTARRQLTFGSNTDFRPTWSLDGTLIAYWSYSADGVALKVIAPDGERDVTIADRLLPSVMDTIGWAPDSRHLTFAGVAMDPPFSQSRIYVAQADRQGASELGDPGLVGFEPAWSPDGKRIAFKARDPDALWLMNADGSNPHRLSKTPGSGLAFENAQWSPDGKRLLFLAGDDAHHDVWVADVDGSGETNLSRSPEDESWPTWSPDGSKVAFVRITAGNGAFVVVNADGSGAVTLRGPTVDGEPPIWSPDATKLFGYKTGGATGLVTGLPPLEGHTAIVVYDLLRGASEIVQGGDDGSWQRKAK